MYELLPPWPRLSAFLFVSLLNPKTAAFFAAFLPQFVNADAAPMAQTITLGALFVSIAAVTDSGYAMAAGAAAPTLARMHRIRASGRYLTASAFIGLGVFAALTGSRTAK